jgi:hypothetical protein
MSHVGATKKAKHTQDFFLYSERSGAQLRDEHRTKTKIKLGEPTPGNVGSNPLTTHRRQEAGERKGNPPLHEPGLSDIVHSTHASIVAILDPPQAQLESNFLYRGTAGNSSTHSRVNPPTKKEGKAIPFQAFFSRESSPGLLNGTFARVDKTLKEPHLGIKKNHSGGKVRPD